MLDTTCEWNFSTVRNQCLHEEFPLSVAKNIHRSMHSKRGALRGTNGNNIDSMVACLEMKS